jgi:DNA-binding CsgD family transcriptional regulator
MPAVSAERVRADLARVIHRRNDLRGFSLAAARILARAVPFDGVCVLTLDPATVLPTSEFVVDGLPPQATRRMAEIEVRGGDVNRWVGLARSGRIAASLSAATGGDLDRSVRHREVRAPNGFGDELRAVLVSGDAAWGGLTLLRGSDHEPFGADDVELVASLSRDLAEGVRRALLASALSTDAPHPEEPSGLVVLHPDNSIALADAGAGRWLTELGAGSADRPLPPVVIAVAGQARNVAAGAATSGGVARARARTDSGAWVMVRASTLGESSDAPTAVTLEPARPHELAPLIAAAYELSGRERAVTELVAQGLDTQAIAARLYISPWTVQDHLKSIFEKVDVSSRGELVARVFFDHYAPRLSEGAPLASNGWFEV